MRPVPDPEATPPDPDEMPIDPRDVASAGRSCSVILILLVVIALILCVGIALRWIFLG